jgi:hypothetical protein
MISPKVDLLPSVTSVVLTTWGQIFLTAFPQEAVTWADGHYSRSSVRAADPFKKLVKLCVEWCNQQGIKPSWAPMYQRQRLEGQPTDAPMYVPRDPQKATEAVGGRRSATYPSTTNTPLNDDEVLISGTRYRVLGVTEAQNRQFEFINNQDAVEGIDKMARLLGKSTAADYFKRVFENLKYEEVKNNCVL